MTLEDVLKQPQAFRRPLYYNSALNEKSININQKPSLRAERLLVCLLDRAPSHSASSMSNAEATSQSGDAAMQASPQRFVTDSTIQGVTIPGGK